MRLYGEILGNERGAQCTLTPPYGGYFEGVKGVGEFSEAKILLSFGKLEVEILGEGMTIEKYYDGDLKIGGKILQWSIVAGERE